MGKLDEELIETMTRDSLFRREEVPTDGSPPKEAILVEGLTMRLGFHPGRLESHRAEVNEMLAELPDVFKEGVSFLQLCADKDGNIWSIAHSSRGAQNSMRLRPEPVILEDEV